MTVTVRYGCESYDKEFTTAPTFGELRTNASLKAILGFSDNSRALLQGVEQPDEVRVPDTQPPTVVMLETRANQKAVSN